MQNDNITKDTKQTENENRSYTPFYISAGVFLFGYVLLGLVGKNPEGFLGFLAPLTILAGIILVPVSLLKK